MESIRNECETYKRRKNTTKLTVILAPAGRQRDRHHLGDESKLLESRRRSDPNAHRVVQPRRLVLAPDLRQRAVDGQRGDGLPVVEVLAVVQLDGVAVHCVVEHVHLEKTDRDLLPRFLAADQLPKTDR